MQCTERQDTILLYVAGELDAGECGELLEHLASGCPQCAAVRAEAEAMLALLAITPAPADVPPGLKHQLLQRVRKNPREELDDGSQAAKKWEWIVMSMSVAAVLAVAVTLGVLAIVRPGGTGGSPGPDQRDLTIANLQQLLTQKTAEVQDLGLRLSAATRSSPSDLILAQMQGGAQPHAVGRLFIDCASDQWFFFTKGMKPLPPGKTYELWLICDEEKLPGGTFNPSANGMAMLAGPVPPWPPGEHVTLAVTDEPAGGVQSPTGTMQILGKLQYTH